MSEMNIRFIVSDKTIAEKKEVKEYIEKLEKIFNKKEVKEHIYNKMVDQMIYGANYV